MLKPDPLSDLDLNVLREIRRLAADVSDCASLLYWETQYPETVRERFQVSARSLSALLGAAQASFAPTTRTRYSWNGQTVTAHEEAL